MKFYLFIFLFSPIITLAQVITTVAGDGTPGYSGNNGTATAAKIKYPSSLTFDRNGNFYFAEGLNNIIRKVSPTGIISTFAGNGSSGFSGDNDSAKLAQLNGPVFVAIDKNGNAYISDEGNNRVRKVDALTQKISTIAGNGTAGYSGDNDSATLASLNYPIGIACDTSGNLYIADHLNFRIRKVNSSGIISTYAGNGTNGFSGDNGPATSAAMSAANGLACDLSGNLYICDGTRVRKVDVVTHNISTIAGNGGNGFNGDDIAATTAELWLPLAVNVDAFGNVYIADQDNNRIRQVSPAGIITTVAGNGIAGYSGDNDLAASAELYDPEGIAFDSCGSLYIADEANCRIRKVTYPKCNYLAVEDIPKEQNIFVYPNPTNDLINIDNIQTATTYRLLNTVGSTVLQGTLQKGNNSISIQSLPLGMYILQLTDEEGNKTVKKIVKQ